jgi:hypothetical protein
LSELDLHLGFARSRTCREDVEDQLGAVHHAPAGCILDVLPLRRRELIVEDDERRILLADERPQLFDLPLAEVGRWIRPVDLLGQRPDDDRARGVRELLELLEMFIDVMSRRCPLARRANEQRALDGRREGDEISCYGTAPGGGQLRCKLTAISYRLSARARRNASRAE